MNLNLIDTFGKHLCKYLGGRCFEVSLLPLPAPAPRLTGINDLAEICLGVHLDNGDCAFLIAWPLYHNILRGLLKFYNIIRTHYIQIV